MGFVQRYRQGSAIQRRQEGLEKVRGNLLTAMRGSQMAKPLYELVTKAQSYSIEGAQHVRLNLHEMGDGTYAAWARGADGKFIGQVTLRPEMNASQLMSAGAAAVLYISMHQIAKELR